MKTHWIVFREGHPAPNPLHHTSVESAEKEARRLAAKENKPFLVFEFIGAATVTKPEPPTHFEIAEQAF
jgi:hypothetical protein